jgi:hypothetical protein
MATRLCVILYNIMTLAMFLCVSRDFHCRWSSIDVTLLGIVESTCCVSGCSELNFFYLGFLF